MHGNLSSASHDRLRYLQPTSWWESGRESVKSCGYLNKELLFGYDHVSPCCMSLPVDKRPPLYIQNFGSLKLSPSAAIDMILEKRALLIDQIQSEGHAGCEACCYFRSYDTESLRQRAYVFDGLVLTHIENCTLKCTYCYQAEPGYDRQKPKQLYVVPEIIREMLSQGILNPHGHCFWGGGEPTIGFDFDETVELLSVIGFTQTLNTNALRHSPQVQDALQRDKNLLLVCSVDAGSPPTYAAVKGADVYGRVMDNLATYATSGGRVSAKYIFLPENYKEALSFAKQAIQRGIREFLIDFDNRCDNGVPPEHNNDLFIASKAYIDYLRSEGCAVAWAGHSRPALTSEETQRVELMCAQ